MLTVLRRGIELRREWVEAGNQFLQTVDMGLTNGCGPGRMIGVKSGDVELRPIVFYSTSFTPSVIERDGETGVPAAGGGDAGFILGGVAPPEKGGGRCRI
jgi:hypothetical protein